MCIGGVEPTRLAGPDSDHPETFRSRAGFLQTLSALPLPFSWERCFVGPFSCCGVLGGREVLICSREWLQITSVDFGHSWRRRNFAIRDVGGGCRFGEVGVSKYGAVYGLRFEANGKRFKCLRGLKSIEAQIILRELERLGVSISNDPSMPGMVEQEKPRRKSLVGIFGG